MTVRLTDVIATLEKAYPPALAESWDSVGLVCGDPAEQVDKVLFAVDATESVVDEALEWGAQALVVHHPLLLRGVDTVGAHTPKGALLHKLIRGGCALFSAHTNADRAKPGVNDALAEALGLTITGPIEPAASAPLDQWVVIVPLNAGAQVQNAMFAVGAGAIGDYRECSWRVEGVGQFRPVAGANPHIGSLGRVETVREGRVEMVAERRLRKAVLEAMKEAHPYEEPAFDIIELASVPGELGIGRIGELAAPETLETFTERVRKALPETVWGVRAAGDPKRTIKRVAVCGGAGDSFLGTVAKLDVDVYVTSDLRHHPVDEHLRTGGPALVDVAHWASEFPWCAQAAGIVSTELDVEVRVSTARTDPWTVGTVRP